MAEIGRIISSTLNIDDVYERFAEKVRELVPFDRISINIFNPRDDTILTAYVTGLDVPDRLKGNAIPVVGTLAEEVIRTRTKLFIQAEDQKKVIRSVSWALTNFSGWDSIAGGHSYGHQR